MNNKNRNSIDGFIPRRAPIHHEGRLGVGSTSNFAMSKAKMATPAGVRTTHMGLPKVRQVRRAPIATPAPAMIRNSSDTMSSGLSRSDIDSSLRDIDSGSDSSGKKSKGGRGGRGSRRVVKIIRRVLYLAVAALVVLGLFVGIQALVAGGRMFSGSLMDLVQKAPLKEDANGRSNILIFGTSEDSEGGEHPGAELSDSIMMVTLDQGEKTASMVSIPRDFWVELDNPCDVGYEAKINTVYMCGSNNSGDESAGAAALQRKVGEVLGFDIQYYAHVNYTVLSDVVDAIGGVEVTIESDDPRGIYDPNFDWMCDHQCNLVNYENGEVAQLDGQKALALARARNAQGGYGLPGGNFDRERNQQKIIKAIQSKAVSAGTLADVGKVTSLIDALGDNLRTNFETKEVRTLIDLAREIGGDSLVSIPLDEEGSAVVTTGSYYGQSVVMPVNSIYDYSGIHSFLRSRVSSGGVLQEGRSVSVYNASGVAGMAQEVADRLELEGLTVVNVGNALETYSGSTYYYGDIDGSEATQRLFEQMGIRRDADRGKSTGITDSEADIKIIVGSAGSS